MSPKAMARFHFARMVFWLIMLPIALLTDLKSSVPFLVTISILALVAGDLSAWQSTLVERRLDSKDSYGEN